MTFDSGTRSVHALQVAQMMKSLQDYTDFHLQRAAARDAAKASLANGNPQVEGGPRYSDEQVRSYMQKHGLTDEQATRKALGV